MTARVRIQSWVSLLVAATVAIAVVVSPATAAAPDRSPIPVDEHLTFSVRYLGIHCGAMTLTSFADAGENGVYRIVMHARTSKFFDGIYRVRVRIEAVYDSNRDSSLSYHHHGQEKSEVKDEIWLVDFDDHKVRRTRNGEEKTIPFSGSRVFDPLSFLYRMRSLLAADGDRATLPMMTSDGDVDTVAEVTGTRRVKTPFGQRQVLLVVPHPAKDELFSKKGKMVIWVGSDRDRLPYQVIFDLAFGKLVAKLTKVEPRADTRDLSSGEER